MAKKLLSLLLSVIMLLSFVACDLETENYDEVSSVQSEQTVIDDTLSQDNSQYDYTEDSSDKTPSEVESQTVQSEDSQDENAGGLTHVDTAKIPVYSGSAYIVINNNNPNFTAAQLTTNAYERYSNLDKLGRCGTAIATCGKEIMPKANEERGSISSVTPSGWVQAKYEGVSGGYLWNRCHLIGWQLSAENANKQNLITGTRYMNINGMLLFENMVADYIRETGNHVAYRITPIYEGNNLVCSGVQMEAYSIEDSGESICFNVYCYNVQPGIVINYATGESCAEGTNTETTPSEQTNTNTTQEASGVMVWIPSSGSKYHTHSGCSNMKNPKQVTKEEAEQMGYEPCKRCH